MFPFNNPGFWEYVGVVIVLLAVAPIVYALWIALRVAYDAIRDGRRPHVFIDDPAFGRLQYFEPYGCWEGNGVFSATDSPISIRVSGTEIGPTDAQQRLYQSIEARYGDLLPTISPALDEYVGRRWQFELCGITINEDSASSHWTADYFADTEEDGDMMYSVEVVQWVVVRVTAGD